MHTRCLFIGGASDGERRSVDDERNSVEVPVAYPNRTWRHENNTEILVEWKTDRYVRRSFAGETVRFDLFVHASLSIDQAMGELVNGYKRRSIMEIRGQRLGSKEDHEAPARMILLEE